jgi:hypothetical protein
LPEKSMMVTLEIVSRLFRIPREPTMPAPLSSRNRPLRHTLFPRIAILVLGVAGALIGGRALNSSAKEAAAESLTFAATDWPWWRGRNRDGIASADQQPPLHWSATENVLWKIPVPGRGHASPTVVGSRIFLATADEKQEVQSVLCYDRATGRELWKVDVHTGGFDRRGHQKSSQASATVACDGQRVFANFLHDGAIYTTALDLDGRPSVTIVPTHSVVEPSISQRRFPVSGSKLEMRSQPAMSN